MKLIPTYMSSRGVHKMVILEPLCICW